MSKREIVVFGSINQDFFNYVERFPRPGESVRGQNFRVGNGGKGANQAAMASKLGASIKMIGMVGDDIFADSSIKNLKDIGINTELIQKVPNINTGCAVITVDGQGENNIVITPGANDKLTPKRAQELEDKISNAHLLLCQAEISQEANLEAFKIAKKYRVTTFLNPAPGNPNLNREILPLTDIICTNETETELLVNEKLQSIEDYKKAALKILEYGPKLVIITLGANGVILAENGKVDKIEAMKVEAIDTSGAGDCFCGAFVYFLTNHPDLSTVEMAKKASNIASLSVTKNGCQSSYPNIDEVKKAGIF